MKKMFGSHVSESILSAVLPAARSAAVLFGFSRSELSVSFICVDHNGDKYSIEKKALPNNFASLYIARINDEPIGSVLFVEITESILHMVGMFVKEQYRGKKISVVCNIMPRNVSIAFFLLNHVMTDITSKKIAVTLEVMNNNESAYRLYERVNLTTNEITAPHQFELCSKDEVLEYSKIRQKKVKRWHDLSNGKNKTGVQWSHVPDYNGVFTWSISRVYYWRGFKGSLKASPLAFTRNKLKFVWSSVRYGSIKDFIYYLIQLKRQK